jgi:flagellar basal body rod protein FlgG
MKTDGIASAVGALRYWEMRQEVMANNLANASTDGFRAERVFARLLDGERPAAESATDRRAGTYRPTGNVFDVALGGDAFFVVKTADGERWSRGGSWQLDASGNLVDASGNAALGTKGPIRISTGVASTDVTIDRAGTVRVNGEQIDTLRVEKGGVGSLQHEDGGRYLPPADRTPVDAAERDVRQGVVEDSNVNAVSSLVDMIAISRNYAFAQKVITTLDGIRATISNDITK